MRKLWLRGVKHLAQSMFNQWRSPELVLKVGVRNDKLHAHCATSGYLLKGDAQISAHLSLFPLLPGTVSSLCQLRDSCIQDSLPRADVRWPR